MWDWIPKGTVASSHGQSQLRTPTKDHVVKHSWAQFAGKGVPSWISPPRLCSISSWFTIKIFHTEFLPFPSTVRSNTLHLASYPFLDTRFGFLPPCHGASVPTRFPCRIPLHFWSLEILLLALWLAVHSKHLLAFRQNARIVVIILIILVV